ncbi:MAG: ABC transporter permease [Ruminococcus flavefaciens]|nr:ABC transporter permease [Ruminococcus flavefaciens]MCM1228547.1 ABC transporter permease [Ruminococcus flavefaciens]
MYRIKAFALRNIRELSRDPLSYIFCLGFPVVMLIVMTLVNESIPPEANMTIFRIDNLAGGIAVFGQTFIMLFTAMTVTKDRSGAFLVRMYASPMKSADFIGGYILPMIATAVIQNLVAFAISLVISLINGTEINIGGLLLALVTLIPSAMMFTGFGLLLGTLFNEKSAPGLCSIIISLGSFLGGIWFDVEATGGVMLKICRVLPFYYCTKTARSSIALDFGVSEFVIPLIVTVGCAVLFTVLASAVFKSKMKADLS